MLLLLPWMISINKEMKFEIYKTDQLDTTLLSSPYEAAREHFQHKKKNSNIISKSVLLTR